MNISKLLITGVMLSAVMLSGCSGMTHREKGTAAGAAVGGVADGWVRAAAGNTITNAYIKLLGKAKY